MIVGFLLVRLEVLHHVILPDETLAAIITGVGLFAGVQAHVPSEVRLVVELLRANLALVRFFAGVLLQMLGVEILEWKSLTALIAFERLVARVEALVVLREVASLVENFVTLDALVKALLRYVVRAGVRAGNLMLLRNNDTLLIVPALLFADVGIYLLLALSLWQIVVGLHVLSVFAVVRSRILSTRIVMMLLHLVLFYYHAVGVRWLRRHIDLHDRQRLVSRR